jgi:putative FmdB family regulatory protein
MPIYAYKCESCGFAKDVLQKMSEPLLTDCPSCGASSFKKQLTAAGFQLKGSGWYATDFKGGAATSAASAASTSAKPASADAAPKSGDGTASKADATPPAAAAGCGGACACH